MQKKTRNVMKELIGKTRKSEPHLPGKFLVNEREVSGKLEIVNEFNTFFANIGACRVGQKYTKCVKAI